MREARARRNSRRPLIVWKFDDGLRGHENQTAGLVEALARRTEIRTHLIAVPRGAAQLRTAWRIFLKRDLRDLPDPDLLVGAGQATHLPLMAARRARGGRLVVVMTPSLPVSWFDLLICPNHDRIPGSANVIVTRGALNRARPGTEKNPGEGLILVGGPDRYYGWSVDELTGQIEEITRRDPAIHWAAASSRRTPIGFLAHLDQLGSRSRTSMSIGCRVSWRPPRPCGSPRTAFRWSMKLSLPELPLVYSPFPDFRHRTPARAGGSRKESARCLPTP